MTGTRLQPHTVTPSIDLYPLMFLLCVSNKDAGPPGLLTQGPSEKEGGSSEKRRQAGRSSSRNKER